MTMSLKREAVKSFDYVASRTSSLRMCLQLITIYVSSTFRSCAAMSASSWEPRPEPPGPEPSVSAGSPAAWGNNGLWTFAERNAFLRALVDLCEAEQRQHLLQQQELLWLEQQQLLWQQQELLWL